MAGKNDLIFNVGVENADTIAREINKALESVETVTDSTSRSLDKMLGRERQMVVELRTVVDDTGARKQVAIAREVGGAWDQISKYVDRANTLQDGSVTRLRQQVNEAKQARDVVAKYATNIARAEDGTLKLVQKTKELNPEWTAANRRVEELTRQLNIAGSSNFWDRIKSDLGLNSFVQAGRAVNDLVNTFQSLSIIIGQVTGFVNNFLDTLGRIEQYKLTFDAIGASVSTVATVFSDSVKIANTYGTSLDSVREGFVKLSPTVLQAGGTIDDVSNIVDSLASRFVAFGLGAEQSNRVMNAVVQAFGKGKLMAEELTQQISEADPAFRVDFANALGVTVAKLNEMVKEGEITNDVMLRIIPQMKAGSDAFQNFTGRTGEAVDAFRDVNDNISITERQVVALIDNTNKLSFERIVLSSRDFIAGILDMRSSLAELFSTLSQSSAIETLSSILGALSQAFAFVIDVINLAVATFNVLLGPIFDAINAFDEFVKGIIGIEPVAAIIASVLGVTLFQSLTSVFEVLKQTDKISGFISALSSIGDAVKTSISTGFAPFVQAASDVAKSLGTTVTNAIDGMINKFDEITGIPVKFEGTKKAISDVGDAAVESASSSTQLISSFDDIAESAYKLDSPLGDVSLDLDSIDTAAGKVPDSLSSVSLELGNIGSATETVGKNTSQLTDDFGILDGAATGSGESLGGVSQQLDLFDANLDDSKGKIGDQAQQLDLLGITVDDSIGRFSDLGEGVGYYGDIVEGSADITSDLSDVLETGTGITNGSAEAFGAAAKNVDDFGVVSDTAAGSAGRAAGGVTSLGTALKGMLTTLGPIVAVLAAIAVAVDVYSAATERAKSITEQISASHKKTAESLKELDDELGKGAAAQTAYEKKVKDIEFALKNQSQAVLDSRNAVQMYNDLKLGLEIENSIKALTKGYYDLKASTDEARVKIQEFAAAGSGASEELKNSTLKAVNAQIAEYQEFISIAQRTRDELLAKVAESQNGQVKAQLLQQIKELDANIQYAQGQLDGFVRYAKENKVPIIVEIDEPALANSEAGLDAFIKKLEAKKAKLAVGTEGYEQAQMEIEGLKLVLDNLAMSPYEIKLQLREGDVEAIRGQLDLFSAVEENIKAVTDLERARFDLQSSYNTYLSQQIDERQTKEREADQARLTALEKEKEAAVEANNLYIEQLNGQLNSQKLLKDEKLATLQQELESLKENGAAKETINAKEKQIKDYTKQANAEIKQQEQEIAAQKKIAQDEEKARELEIKKEREIAAAQEKQRLAEKEAQEKLIKGIQAEAAVAAYAALLEQQKAEATSFAGKQQMERIERDILGIKLEQTAAELKAAEIAAQRDYTKAVAAYQEELKLQTESGKKDEEKLAKLRDQVVATDGVKNSILSQITAQDQIIAKFQEGTSVFEQQQRVQADTFAKGQEIARTQAAAAAAQYGILIGEAAKLNEKSTSYKTITAGTIEVAGKLVTITKEVANTKLDDPMARAKKKAEELNSQLGIVKSSSEGTATSFGTITTNIGTANSKTVDLKKTTEQVSSAAKGASDGISGFAGNVTTAANNMTPLVTKSGEFKTKIDESKTSVIQVDSAVSGLKDKISTTKDEANEFATKFDVATKKVNDLKTAIENVKVKEKLTAPLQDANDAIGKINTSSFNAKFKESGNDAKKIADNMKDAKDRILDIINSKILTTMSDFSKYAGSISSQFSAAKDRVDGIVSAIKSLNGFTATVTVQVVKVNSNFAGGPVKAGELTTINELGREAFLTKGGHLSMINKPKNSLWRPPTSGTVIPAHIAQNLDIPTAGVKMNRSASSAVQGMARRDAGAPDVARALYAALESSGVISNSRYNASSQAAHALQIGKLTHAINKLVDKNWDVNVNIKERNTGLGAHRTINRIV